MRKVDTFAMNEEGANTSACATEKGMEGIFKYI